MPRSSVRPPSRARAAVAPRPSLARWLLPAALITLATALLASAASAQSVPVGEEPHAAVTPVPVASSDGALPAAPVVASSASDLPTGPRLAASAAGVRAGLRSAEAVRPVAAPSEMVPQDNRPGFRRNFALVVVGLAAVAIGTSVDDGAGTVLVLGGAGLSLYGLYQILR